MMAKQRLGRLFETLRQGRAQGLSPEDSTSRLAQASRRHRFRVILGCLVLAFVVELLSFDFPTLSTLGYTARQLTDSSTSYDPGTGAQT